MQHRSRRACPPPLALLPGAAVVVALALGACTGGERPHPACEVYLSCFFPDGGSAYPPGTFDGGVVSTDDGGSVAVSFDYTSFSEEDVRRQIFAAYGEGGLCWKKRKARNGGDDDSLRRACIEACQEVLLEDCARLSAARDGLGGPPPVCLDPDVPGDDLPAHGYDQTCLELKQELADAGTAGADAG